MSIRETESDRRNERRIVDDWLARMNWGHLTAKKLKSVMHVDYALVDTTGVIYHWAECKQRREGHEQLTSYPWIPMNLAKWDAARRLVQRTNSGSLVYIIETADGFLGFAQFDGEDLQAPRHVFWFGNDDEEPVVAIKQDEFFWFTRRRES